MGKDRERKLLESIGIDEEAMPGDNEDSKEEREFKAALDKALKEGRIPIECIDLVPISEDMAVKVIVAKEC